jgi:SHAQKYF class myb-like DNA-binding protein
MEPDNYDYDSTPPMNPGEPTKHTEFLDLTNGEGGEILANNSNNSMYEDDDYYGETTSPNAGGSPGGSLTLTGAGGGKFDPTTPGRVVETGQEHTGRWTKEEHEAFLSALKMYGKEWKKVAAKVKTRTVVQTRTHAQKYFQKLAKAMEGKEEVTEVDMGVASSESTKKAGASSQKKKQRVTPPAVKVARTPSVASAAQVISNLGHTPVDCSSAPPFTHGFQTAISSGLAPGSGYAPSPGALASLSDQGTLQTAHGFSSSIGDSKPSFSSPFGGAFAQQKSTIGTSAFPVKIVAPEHDSAIKRGKFPEPSPAACGKRKLAEIAAARMLAGVAASESLLPPKNNFVDNIEDGAATPPPEQEIAEEWKVAPPPPPFAASNDGKEVSAQPKKMGFSLQIVNPESLGVSHEQIEKRRKDGQGSPVTPWEGQLQALVR